MKLREAIYTTHVQLIDLTMIIYNINMIDGYAF